MLDDVMIAIKKDNLSFKDVLIKPNIYIVRLGDLIDLMSFISLGNIVSRSKDVLGRVYKYFLERFAGTEGKGGEEFLLPSLLLKSLLK